MRIGTGIILIGGAGLRLRPQVSDRPKALVEILGKPMLEWIVEWLRSYDVRNLVFGVSYEKEKIMNYFGDGKTFDVNISYSTHSLDGGTAEGIRLAMMRFVSDSMFLAMNGDELLNLNLYRLFEYHIETKSFSTIVVAPFRSPYGVISLDSEMNVRSFREKPLLSSMYVNAGVYVFNQDVLSYIPERGEVERTTFPELAKRKLLRAYLHDGFWRTIDTYKDLIEAERELKKGRFLKE